MKRFLICAIVLLLTVTGLAEESPAVRVGDRVFSVEEVQNYINAAAINLRMTVGAEPSEVYDDAQEFLSDAAEYFVTETILEDKFAEYGLDQLNADEAASLRLTAQQTYEQIWQSISKLIEENYPDLTGSERVVPETMESAGYSMEDIYDAARRELLQERLLEKLCPEADVTLEDAKAWYLENEVAPCKERYENNVPLFEDEVLLADGSSAYVPEGYFYIKYILLQPDSAEADALRQAQMKADLSQQEKQSAYDALAQAALAEAGDTADARARYQAAEAACEEAAQAMDAATQAAEEAFLPMTNVVRTAMNDGVSFEELIDRYSCQPSMNTANDAGFPFHPDSEIWDENIREAVCALTRYGECTDPVYSPNYVYIICRMDDMSGGAYEPTEDELEEIRQDLRMQTQAENLDALVRDWRNEYEISIELSQLTMP